MKANTLQPIKDKVEDIVNMKRPENMVELQSLFECKSIQPQILTGFAMVLKTQNGYGLSPIETT